MKWIKFKNIFLYYFCFFIALILCGWIFYSRVLLIRLPKDLNKEIPFFFFIIALISILILTITLKKYLFPKESKFSQTQIYIFIQEWIILPILTLIETSYLIIYKNIFYNKRFSHTIYFWLYKHYKNLWGFFYESDFFILFIFYFFPLILISLTFFIEISVFHKLHIFYKLFPLYLIPILFNVIFLNALFEFAILTKDEINNYITLVETPTGVSYQIREDYINNLNIIQNFTIICAESTRLSNIICNMGRLKDLQDIFEKKI